MNTRNRSIALFAATLAAFILATASANAAPRRGPKSVADLIQEEQALVLAECKPTAQQQEALKAKFAAKLAALETWDKANGDKLKSAQDAAKTARAGSDAAAKSKANGDVKTLMDARKEATAEADKAILVVLSDEQKVTLAGAQLALTTLPKYKKANLTDEQTTKIKSACALAAKDLAGFAGDDKKDKQGRTTTQKSLKWAIDNVILTADQRGIVAPKVVPAAPAVPVAPVAPTTPTPATPVVPAVPATPGAVPATPATPTTPGAPAKGQ